MRDLETIAAETIDRLRSALASKTEEAERERKRAEEAERAKFGTPCSCDSWVKACQKAEDALAAKTEEAERLREALRHLLVFHGADNDTLIAHAAVDYRRAVQNARALPSPESAPAPDAGAASGPCRCTGIGPNPSHKPPCAPAPDADEPLDGWPCVECGRAGEACVCGPCGVLGCRNYSPCPVHDTDAHARDLRRLDERDRVVGAPRAPAPESAETANSSSKETDHGR